MPQGRREVARACAIVVAVACSRGSRDDGQSRSYEERGRRHFVAGEREPALVYLARAYELGDRPSLRFLLGRALDPRTDSIEVGAGTDYAFSPDATWLAIAGEHGVALWNTRTGKLDKTLPMTAVTAFAWRPDSTQLVAAGETGAQFWDVQSGRASVIDGVRGRPFSTIERIVWGTRARALVVEGEAIAITDLTPPRESLVLAKRPLAFDGERALVCDATCALVSLRTRTPIAIDAHHAAFAYDGSRIAVASATHLHILDRTGTELARHAGAFGRLAFSTDGALVVASDLTIWDASTGGLLERLPDPAPNAALSRDGALLATQGPERVRIRALTGERRTPAAVRALVRCRVPLALVDGRPQPAPVVCTE